MPGPTTDILIGVDSTGRMWTTTSLDSNWTRSAAAENLIAAAGIDLTGSIVGVSSTNNEVKTTDGGSTWAGVAAQTTQMLGVRACPDRTLLGVGTDHQLYSAPDLQTAWTKHTTSGAVLDAYMNTDGSIVGIGTGHDLWTLPDLQSTTWSSVPNSGSVKSVCLAGGLYTPQTTILGVGTDDKLWTRQGLSGTWQPTTWPSTAPTGGVIYIAVGSSGGTLPL